MRRGATATIFLCRHSLMEEGSGRRRTRGLLSICASDCLSGFGLWLIR